MKDIATTAESLLGDLSGYGILGKKSEELQRDLAAYTQSQFENWSSDMISAIENNELGYKYEFLL